MKRIPLRIAKILAIVGLIIVLAAVFTAVMSAAPPQ